MTATGSADDGARGDAVVAEAAPAKLNLILRVTGRRSDGYHDLATVMAAVVPPADRLEVTPWNGAEPGRIHLEVDGPAAPELAAAGVPPLEVVDVAPADNPASPANLVARAAIALARAAGRRHLPAARIRLTKHIPVGAGLGGGSADAAAALRALNRWWGLGLERADLERLGAAVGADVPFCVRGGVQRATGAGERLLPIANRLRAGYVLVVPREAASTREAYRMWDARAATRAGAATEAEAGVEAMVAALAAGDLEGVARAVANDLSGPACALCPSAKRLVALLRAAGCDAAAVTGSGCGVWGLVAARRRAAVVAALGEMLGEVAAGARVFSGLFPAPGAAREPGAGGRRGAARYGRLRT